MKHWWGALQGLMLLLFVMGILGEFEISGVSFPVNRAEHTPLLLQDSGDSGFFVLTPPVYGNKNLVFRSIERPVSSVVPGNSREVREKFQVVSSPPTPPARKNGKYDPSVEQKLEIFKNRPLSETSKSTGIRVFVYVDPKYLAENGFRETLSEISKKIRDAGGTVLEANANPIVAVIPNENVLNEVESIQGVVYIRDSETWGALPLAGSVTSEGVYNVSANYAWAKGYYGQGIKAGILDVYYGGFSNYQDLVNQGELPTNTYLYSDYGTGVGVHGSACAEVLYDVAPGISGLYLGIANDTEEMYNVTKWFLENGVKVISHSVAHFAWLPTQFDSNGDNNPEFWDVYKVIEYAINNGATWVNSAGDFRLEHWEGDWRDQDNDGYLDIYGTPSSYGIEYDREGIQVVLNSNYASTFLAWIRWSDYPYPDSGPSNDFDAYLYCYDGRNWVLKASSERWQNGAFGQEPLEVLSLDLNSAGLADGNNHYCMVVVEEYYAPDASQMHFDIWWKGIAGYWYYSDSTYNPMVKTGSVTPPADHPEVIAVGAVGWENVTKPTVLTSEGPGYNPYLGSGTWLKPNVVAPVGVSTSSYGTQGFGGTSASAPHVAGVVADLLSVVPSLSPSTVMKILELTARDINVSGPDYLTGYGLVNASDATPQVVHWIYPTPPIGSIIDTPNVTFNLTTLYKALNESNLTLDGAVYSMTGGSNDKAWWYTATLQEGGHTFNATTLDKFNVWIVRTKTQGFTINLSEKNPVEGIDGDPSTAPKDLWADDDTVSPDSSEIVNETFVWKDANDAYTSPCTGHTYNITELQLKADSDYIYILLRFADPLPVGTNPAPFVGVGFDVNGDNSIDYTAYAFLNKPGVSEGTAEFLDVYNSSWDNVALEDPTHTVFVALNNAVEMQIPREVIGNPDGVIGISAWVYEGLGGSTICSGSDQITDNGNTITSVDITQVPFFSNLLWVFLLLMGVLISLRRR